MSISDPSPPPASRRGWRRALTSGWLLSPLIVIALLAVSFFGYGYYTRHQNTSYQRGGAFGATGQPVTKAGRKAAGGHAPPTAHSAASPSSQTHSSKTLPHKVAGKSSAPNAPHAASSASVTTHAATVATHHRTSTPTPSTPQPSDSTTAPATAAVVTPRSGIYSLAVTGHEQAEFGPIAACKHTLPSRASLDIHHAVGEPATSYDFDMRLYPGDPNQHDERHIYNYSTKAVDLSYEQETVTCLGIRQSSIVDYSPVQTRVELPLTVGKTWHNHGGGASRTETGNSQVIKRTSLTVQGHRYTVYEISTKLVLTGNETGSRNQTWYYSPQLAMPLKFGETLNGDRKGAKYSETYMATVVSLP